MSNVDGTSKQKQADAMCHAPRKNGKPKWIRTFQLCGSDAGSLGGLEGKSWFFFNEEPTADYFVFFQLGNDGFFWQSRLASATKARGLGEKSCTPISSYSGISFHTKNVSALPSSGNYFSLSKSFFSQKSGISFIHSFPASHRISFIYFSLKHYNKRDVWQEQPINL